MRIKQLFLVLAMLIGFSIGNAQYTLIELPSPLGGQVRAFDINDNGEVVGDMQDPAGVSRGFHYLNGVMTDIGTLGGTITHATAINNSGVIVGYSLLSGNTGTRAFIYQSGVMTNLNFDGFARDVNESGLILLKDQYYRSYIYDDGLFTDLGLLQPTYGNYATTSAVAINDFGVVVGWANQGTTYPNLAIKYENEQLQTLGVVGAPYGNSSKAYAINNSGLVVGQALSDNGAYLWPCYFSNGVAIPILNGTSGVANSINDEGTIIGTYAGPSNRAFKYKDGGFTDLHQYFPGWFQSLAMAINENGWIVGYGMNAQQEIRAWILIPQQVTQSFFSTSDSYIRSGQPNQNQGDETFLRVRQNGNNRSLVQFDQGAVQSFVAGKTVVSAKVRVFVTVSNNWGVSGRDVGIHRLTQSWTELGSTWNCPDDSNTANGSPDGPQWEMSNSSLWPFASAASSLVLHTNNMSGWVEFDVTSDVQAFADGAAVNYGWILKKAIESQAGSVDYSSKEGLNPPEFVITVQ